MKYAILIDGVIDTISFEPQDAPWVAVPDNVFAGYRLSDGAWVAPTPEPAAPTATLSKIDFCRALYAAQILPADLVVDAALGKWPATFEAAIASLSEPARVDAKLAWAGAATVSRTAPLFQSLLSFFAAQQGLSADQAQTLGDQIFAQKE